MKQYFILPDSNGWKGGHNIEVDSEYLPPIDSTIFVQNPKLTPPWDMIKFTVSHYATYYKGTGNKRKISTINVFFK